MTIAQALAMAQQQLRSESPDIDAQVLLCHILQAEPAYLHTWPDKALTASQQQQYLAAIVQRNTGQPVAHITGQRGFWTLDLAVTADTLIPRPDTEILVSTALSKIQPHMVIADLGTGSGAIALALASERSDITVLACDRMASALAIAQHNNRQHSALSVALWQGDWLTAIADNSLDMVISNPPYIEEHDPHLMQGDVRFEPRSALTAGEDGLDDVRCIAHQAQRCLKPQGWLMVEHGYQQADAVQKLFQQQGFKAIATEQDYGGHDRVTIAQQPL